MFKLVLPATLVITAVLLAFAVPRLIRSAMAGTLVLRRPAPERTWALFVDGRPTGRKVERLADLLRSADRGAEVVVYRRKDEPGLCARLGVSEAPTLVLGDGQGGARLRLEGQAAIDGWVARRFGDVA